MISKIFCLLVTAIQTYVVLASNCKLHGSNRVVLPKVLTTFNSNINNFYVGQKRAVKEVRMEVQSFIYKLHIVEEMMPNDHPSTRDSMIEPLVLHFVGPSGTGKSFLTEIVATSLYKTEACIRADAKTSMVGAGAVALGSLYAFSFSNPITAVGTAVAAAAGALIGPKQNIHCSPLDNWDTACGIVHISFGEHSEEGNKEILQKALEKLADTLVVERYGVLILDDFIFCTGICQQPLKSMLKSKSLDHPTQGKISAKRVLILLTSDFTRFGVNFGRGEDYYQLVEKVENAVQQYWTQDSFEVSAGRIIPFAPLSDDEIAEVTDKMITKFEVSLQSIIKYSLLNATPKDIRHVWSGSFYCSHTTRRQIIDHLYDSIEIRNSRAIVEEFQTVLLRSLVFPSSIEQRLITGHFMDSEVSDDSIIGRVSSLLPLTEHQTIKTRIYSDDIILEFSSEETNYVQLRVQ